MTLDQVKEHPRVPPVLCCREVDPRGEGDADVDHLLLENFPDRPAGEDIRVKVKVPGRQGLPFLHVLEHSPVLIGRVIDPDRQHPVHDLVIAHTLHFREPPDTAGRDGADPHLAIGSDRPVLDRFTETGRGCLKDLLQVLGERDIIEKEDRPGPELVMVIERLI